MDRPIRNFHPEKRRRYGPYQKLYNYTNGRQRCRRGRGIYRIGNGRELASRGSGSVDRRDGQSGDGAGRFLHRLACAPTLVTKRGAPLFGAERRTLRKTGRQNRGLFHKREEYRDRPGYPFDRRPSRNGTGQSSRTQDRRDGRHLGGRLSSDFGGGCLCCGRRHRISASADRQTLAKLPGQSRQPPGTHRGGQHGLRQYDPI